MASLKFQFVVLCVCLGLQQSRSVDPVSAAVAKQLVEQAQQDLAPFKKSALDRLHGEIFGTGRAARSTDIVIFNKSGKTFQLVEEECETGGWSGTLLPEYEIPAYSSVVYGAESYGFLSGATECVVKYRSKDGASFEVNISNPYIGPVLSCARASGGIIPKVVVGRGNNNLVRVFVDEKGINVAQKKYKDVNGFLRCYE